VSARGPRLRPGLFLDFRNPQEWRRPWEELYVETLELAVEAEQLGLHAVWLTEHHFVDDGYSPSCLVAAAALAARTSKVRIGTFTMLLPLHNAVRVAEDAAMVDIFSGGRLDLGLALGYRPEEFEAFGYTRALRRSRMEEGLAVLEGLFAGSPFSFAGEHYNLRDVRLGPEPVQRPLPLWLGARSEAAAERAGRHRAHLALSGQPELYHRYAAALRTAGGEAADRLLCRRIRVLPTLGDAERAWRRIEPHVRYQDGAYNQWYRAGADVPGDLQDRSQFDRSWVVGPPAEVAQAILRWRGDLPITDAISLSVPPGVPPREALDWIGLYLAEVQPILDRELGY
jgi:alkanesulfonate monooxygenase SsuD/methylene tetrahydromethanopterin reductase-like flavin-dependent oxidoreductase (luciferase family)